MTCFKIEELLLDQEEDLSKSKSNSFAVYRSAQHAGISGLFQLVDFMMIILMS